MNDPRKARILVIEDSEDVRDVIVESLRARGWEVLVTTDGDEGVAAATKELPDLILCDIRMPRMDGYAVLQELRQQPATSAIPFIFLTGLTDRMNMRQGMELGADDYLLKPFTVQELIAAVEARLKKQELLNQSAEKKAHEVRESITFSLPHELVTPLNSILGFSSLILDSTDLSAEETREFAAHIRKAGQRLRGLIEKFLLYAQLETLASDPTHQSELRGNPPAPLGEALSALAERFAHDSGRGPDLVREVRTVSHHARPSHLQRLVQELVENAARFSTPGTPIIFRAEAKDGQMAISVTNQGAGFTADEIRRVTANLQFNRRVYEQQGTGLGLAIVRRLAELYRGSLHIESVPGQDVTVTVLLPRA